MLTVADLHTLLAGIQPDTVVTVAAVSRLGSGADVAALEPVTLSFGRRDDGTIDAVWIVALDSTRAPQPPALLQIPCRCGQLVDVDDETQLHAHDDHLWR